MPVLIGWAAVTGRLDWAPVILFLIVFFLNGQPLPLQVITTFQPRFNPFSWKASALVLLPAATFSAWWRAALRGRPGRLQPVSSASRRIRS